MIEWIISSSVLIAVIVALRYIFKGKISLRLQYALWALVLIRLLIPASFFNHSMSIMSLIPTQSSAQVERVGNSPLGYVGYDLPSLAIAEPDPNLSLAERQAQYDVNVEQYNNEIEAAKAETGVAITVGTVLYTIWLTGIIFVGLCLLISNLRFYTRLKKTRKETDNTNCPLKVYVSDRVDTPCLFGLFRPAIYVTPEVVADETTLRHVIAHETTHYYHGDHIWSALRGVCLAVHWFNPLVWLAASLSRRDAELACDESTIKRIGEDQRNSYGRTLIDLTCQKRGSLLVTATTMTGSRKSIKERITLIAKKPKMAIYTLIAVGLIAVLAVGCTFTGAKEEQDSFSPDTVSMVQTLSSAFPPDPITDTETVTYLWDMYQDFEFDGTTETLDQENVWSISVSFSDSVSGESEHFTIFQGGLCLLGDDYETFYILRDSADIYNEFLSSFDEAKKTGAESQNGVTISVDDLSGIQDEVIAYAKDYVQQRIEDFSELGENHPDGIGNYTVINAKITDIIFMNTGTAALEHSINMYRLEYRLQPDHPENVVLAGGMIMEDGWITEWGSTGQPYLLMLCSWNDSGTDIWQRIGTINTDVINVDYGTPEMVGQYGNAYTAAAMELYNKYLDTDSTSETENSDSWSEEDVERWKDEVALYGFSISPIDTSEYGDIGRVWAEAYVKQYIENTSDDNPLHSTSSAVLKSELYAESLIANPKTIIFNMRFACEAADEKAFERWFVGWAGPLDASEYPQYEGWMEFGWFIVLQESEDGSWSCTDAGTGGYGGWGFLTYDGDGVFDMLLEEAIAANGDYTPENVLRYLPLVDWSSFDSRWGAEGWNTLWNLLDDCCLTEGRVYGPEETRMWTDVYTNDQAYRDLYVMLAALNTDGAHAEVIANLLLKQRDYDPSVFNYCLQQLTADQQDRINGLVEMA